jgi:hypothetical protein
MASAWSASLPSLHARARRRNPETNEQPLHVDDTFGLARPPSELPRTGASLAPMSTIGSYQSLPSLLWIFEEEPRYASEAEPVDCRTTKLPFN